MPVPPPLPLTSRALPGPPSPIPTAAPVWAVTAMALLRWAQHAAPGRWALVAALAGGFVVVPSETLGLAAGTLSFLFVRDPLEVVVGAGTTAPPAAAGAVSAELRPGDGEDPARVAAGG